jgi:esterase
MELFYRKEGEGPVIIIIHGLYGSSDNWMNIGRRLAENHTVYMIDQRNHGRSPFADSNTYEDMKSDLAEFFNKQGIESATLLGHSMGGKTAMWFAADYPEKVEKLVVADITPKNYIDSQEKDTFGFHLNILKAMQGLNLNKAKKRHDFDSIFSAEVENEKVRRFLLKNVTKDKASRKFKWRLNIDVLINDLEEIVGGVNEEWFEDRIPITIYPVIFIRGLKSVYILPEDEAIIKKIYPESTIVDIEGAGHWLHAEKPNEFMKAVKKCC